MNSSARAQLEDSGRKEFQSLLEETCSGALSAWLEDRRWFADKGRGIASVALEDALIERVASHWIAMAVIQVTFEDGNAARYLLPLTLSENRLIDERGELSGSGSHSEAIVDATGMPWFGEWLLDHLEKSSHSPSEAWTFVSHPAAKSEIELARTRPPSIVRAEQSNSSLRFDDILVVKLFRRLQAGPNPDEEVLRALASAGFKQVPRYFGSIFWRSMAGESFAIAVAQEYVPNLGDGWTWMLQRLEEVASGRSRPEIDDFEAERLLGLRTGELHVALSRLPESDFAPEVTNEATIADDARRTRLAIEETIGLLQEQRASLPEKLQKRVPEAMEGLNTLSSRVDGYSVESGTARIRVHGDYHLGQTLRTPDGDWTIIDFEGEPARALDERRQRTSALKDVAGMLRSFAYARGVAERAPDAVGIPGARTRLKHWETGARQAFLEGYREATEQSAVPLAPDADEFERALAAWELDKALYEVAYEARNRPGWIELPLRGLLPGLFDQPAEAAGTFPA